MLSSDTPLSEVSFVVFDVETTGLGEQDRITEVAAVRMRDSREIDQLVSLVNPEQPIPPESTAVSGIDDRMVAEAPTFPTIAPALERLLAGAVLVAHNAPFDLHYLSRELRRCGRVPWEGPVLDTLRLARNTVTLPGYSLGALREQLGLEPVPTHRALADVRTTIALLAALLERHEPALVTLGDLLRAQEPIPMRWEDLGDTELPTVITQALMAAGPRGATLEIVYAGKSGARRYRIVPQRLERNGPLIYLQARLVEQSGSRTFRADRITAAAACSPSEDARAEDSA
jgi:DNA polymerase-3 subunit epsilon